MADLLLLEAKDLAGKGEHLRACAALTKAKRLQPTNAEILIDLSLSLLHLNKVSKALQSADQAIQLDPVSHRAYYARALALADAQAQASNAYASDDSGNDSLGIDDPDLLDIPPPMTYEAWSVNEMECDAE